MSAPGLGRRTEVQLRFNDVDVTADLSGYLLGMTYTDDSGGAADDLRLTLEDRDGIWLKHWLRKEPDSAGMSEDGSGTETARYTKISAVIAVRNADGNGGDLVLDCGSFELDNVQISGPPTTAELSATALSYESAVRKTLRYRSWTGTNLRAVAGTIAGGGGYGLMYLASCNPSYPFLLQEDESDIAFLLRLCSRHALKLKVTAGSLVIYDPMEQDAQAAARVIRYGDGSYSRFRLTAALNRTAYSACRVTYDDDRGGSYSGSYKPETEFSGGEVLELTRQVSSDGEARELAHRALRAANRGQVTGQFSMAGDPRMTAGVNIELEGFGDFDGKYAVEKSTHTVQGAYTTQIEITKVIEGY